jgi:dihydropteroate synthase
MHRQGDAHTMQDNPHYDDVVADVEVYLTEVASRARAAGVADLWLDYGIGFGKTTAHNLALLAATDRFVALARHFDASVLVGASRKRFLGEISGLNLPPEERLEGTVAVHAWAVLAGAEVIRVHDVPVAVQLRELLVRPTIEVVAP